jgi:hypothetical protein
MKKIVLLILVISLTISSCKKETQSEYNGKIIGYDLTMCACCGGIIINIDNTKYRFDSLPANSGINIANDSFPIYVIVSWHKKNPQCLGDEIIIDKIRKQ